MARLFGLMGNRADLVGRVLAAEGDVLRAGREATHAGDDSQPMASTPLGWGMGFYQGGEVLLRRRPLDDRPEIDLAKQAADVRADLLLAHVRAPTVGSLRTENTHPFRYRQWLFAATGTLPSFDAIRDRLLEGIPAFLRSGIRGETDSEAFFHVFLSFLHDAGKLDDGIVPPRLARDALRASLSMVDGIAAEVGAERTKMNALLTDGEVLIALHRGEPMACRVLAGKSDAEHLIGDDLQLRRKTPELGHMHFALVASDFDAPPPPRWKTLAGHAIVTLTRDESPAIEAL